MRTVILITLVIAVEILTALVVGMEKYAIKRGKIVRVHTKTIPALASFLISMTTILFYVSFEFYGVIDAGLPIGAAPLFGIAYGVALYGVSIIGGKFQIMQLRKTISHLTIEKEDGTIATFRLIKNTPD